MPCERGARHLSLSWPTLLNKISEKERFANATGTQRQLRESGTHTVHLSGAAGKGQHSPKGTQHRGTSPPGAESREEGGVEEADEKNCLLLSPECALAA